MNTRSITILAVAIAAAVPAPCYCEPALNTPEGAAEQRESGDPSDDLVWGDSREVLAAVQRAGTERSDSHFEEGGLVDPQIQLRPFPKMVLPALNPFAEMDLYVVMSDTEAAIVLPRTRRILKVYKAPANEPARPVHDSSPRPVSSRPVAADQPPLGKKRPPATTEFQPLTVATRQAASESPETPKTAAPAPRSEHSAALPVAAASEAEPEPGANAVRLLLDRAEARRKIGDILATRQFLEHASKLGSMEALRLLAQTYEAKSLAGWGVRGVKPDDARAAELYSEAGNGQSRANLSAHAEGRR